jgi:hypothetical protein
MKTEPKSRPIPYSPPMVRATRTDAKTQTRRIVKDTGLYAIDASVHGAEVAKRELERFATQCPYGQPGSLLWVREEHRTLRFNRDTREAEAEYTEDGSRRTVTLTEREAALFVKRKFPFAQTRARFMYRSYSRITLEIVSVRVERLQAISVVDAIAEGVERWADRAWYSGVQGLIGYESPVGAYRELWESINGPGSWDANPWVWVVSFRRVQP